MLDVVTSQTSLSPDVALPILNIAAYKFCRLGDLKSRRQQLRDFCRPRGIRGTILLSPEGINLFLAGKSRLVQELIDLLIADPMLADLDIKRSWSEQIPFRRMLVKVKNEIIAFGVSQIDPISSPGRKISARELKTWLDEERPVTLLDVRNNYEIKLGTFHGAQAVGVDHFRDFPAAVAALPQELHSQPIVMFCTGGIRCEKAGPLMEQAGFENVVQLDGGILKYFELCGSDHYDGDCFVFDQRVALDPQLQETDVVLCFACQASLTRAEQQSPQYVVGDSCPHCYQTPAEQADCQIAKRHARIRELTNPLPGSTPYTNRKPLNVPARCDGQTLLEMLNQLHPHVSSTQWESWCANGQMERNHCPITATTVVRAGERIEHVVPGTVEPEINPAIEILFEDSMLVIVNKPAPLPMHSSGRFHRNTLSYILDLVYAPQRLRLAHRLDANTTGVVVMSRTRNVAARVQSQFEAGEVSKEYVARVRGVPAAVEFVCDASISSTPGQSGARQADVAGRTARTEFTRINTFDDGTSLVLARPITGRTNQIRLHLAHLGWPIVGDPTYLRDGIGDRQTLNVADPPLCLHAWRIAFRHPADDRRVEFQAPWPSWTTQG